MKNIIEEYFRATQQKFYYLIIEHNSKNIFQLIAL